MSKCFKFLIQDFAVDEPPQIQRIMGENKGEYFYPVNDEKFVYHKDCCFDTEQSAKSSVLKQYEYNIKENLYNLLYVLLTLFINVKNYIVIYFNLNKKLKVS